MVTFTDQYFEKLDKTRKQTALDMWTLGELIQEHHGAWTREKLEEEAPDLAYLLDAPMLLKDFIFTNKDDLIWCRRNLSYRDSPKSELKLMGSDINNIWASGKKDERWRWVRTWLENFGAMLDPDIRERCNALRQEWRDHYKPPEHPEPKRRHDTDWLENKPTVEVAHRWRLALLMADWMQNLDLDQAFDMCWWMSQVWSVQAEKMQSELEYRTEATPKDRGSKKKNEAARKDFRKASLYLAGAEQIYSEEFVQMATSAEFPFDPNVDYKHLPKQAPEKAPVMHMTQRELIDEFMHWLTNAELDPNSFEADDARILRNRLVDALEESRKTLARAKGQPVETTKPING